MDEYMIRELLRNKGMSENDFMYKMKNILGYDRGMRNSMRDDWNYDSSRHSDHQLKYMIDELSHEDKIKLMEMLDTDSYRNSRNYYNNSGSFRSNDNYESISEEHAHYLVSQMYHISNNKKHSGEQYDIHKAKEVFERYRGMIPSHITVYEVYVAINAQYHDYCSLYKTWFGDNIDNKIIESAISFWFKDVDFKGGNKVAKYFD